jgi:acyl carrier protein
MIDDFKLKEVISNVLGIPTVEINNDSSPDNIEKWDSLSHLKLVMAIESEFNVELSPEDSMDMLSVKLIRIILQDALKK